MATVDDVTQPEGEPDVTAEGQNNGEGSTATPAETEGQPLVAEPQPSPEVLPEPEPEPAAPVAEPSLQWSESLDSLPLSCGWDAEPLVLDWFGQGEPDLLVTFGGGTAGRSARIYRPLPAEPGVFPRLYDAGQDLDGLDGLRCVCPIPNGRASRFDVVALAAEGLVLLGNSGSATEPRFDDRTYLGLPADLGFGPGQVSQMVSVDWDGDGKLDLLLGFDATSGYWPDEGVPVEQQVGLNQRGGHPGYDNRGAWRGKLPEGRLHWLQNVGEIGQPRFETRPEIASDLGALGLGIHPAPLALAWGGGGGLELMAIDQQGAVKVYRNFGGQQPPVLMEPRSLNLSGTAGPLLLPEDRTVVSVADIDGDRRPELVFGTADGHIYAVHSGPSRDTANAPVPFRSKSVELHVGGRTVVTVGDLDADGGLDLVVGDGPGRLYFLKDVGKGPEHRYEAPVLIEAGGERFQVDPGPDGRQFGPIASKLGYACPTIVDWSAHDRLDLIVGTAGGDVLLFHNDGAKNQPRFAFPVALKCAGAPLIIPPRVRPAAAAWNGGEQPDLIALDLQGFLAVFPRTGTTEVGAPVPIVDRLGRLIRLDGGFGQGGRCALWAGHWTGSDRLDLLVGIPRDARYLIPGLTGRPMTSLDDQPTVLLLQNIGNNAVIPRAVYLADGKPLVLGTNGCSPCGVDVSGAGRLDLLVGTDDGKVHYFRRDALTW